MRPGQGAGTQGAVPVPICFVTAALHTHDNINHIGSSSGTCENILLDMWKDSEVQERSRILWPPRSAREQTITLVSLLFSESKIFVLVGILKNIGVTLLLTSQATDLQTDVDVPVGLKERTPIPFKYPNNDKDNFL